MNPEGFYRLLDEPQHPLLSERELYLGREHGLFTREPTGPEPAVAKANAETIYLYNPDAYKPGAPPQPPIAAVRRSEVYLDEVRGAANGRPYVACAHRPGASAAPRARPTSARWALDYDGTVTDLCEAGVDDRLEQIHAEVLRRLVP